MCPLALFSQAWSKLLTIFNLVMLNLVFSETILHFNNFTKELFSSTSQIDTIYFDIRKAFDSVSHNLLLSKLWLSRINGKLFKSYLSDRYQFVTINNCSSNQVPVISRVPQGSILGFLLLLIYCILMKFLF